MAYKGCERARFIGPERAGYLESALNRGFEQRSGRLRCGCQERRQRILPAHAIQHASEVFVFARLNPDGQRRHLEFLLAEAGKRDDIGHIRPLQRILLRDCIPSLGNRLVSALNAWRANPADESLMCSGSCVRIFLAVTSPACLILRGRDTAAAPEILARLLHVVQRLDSRLRA